MGIFSRRNNKQVEPSGENYFNLGIEAHERKDAVQAIEYLEKAVLTMDRQDEPKLIEAYNRLGTNYKRTNQLQRAFDTYQKAEEMAQRTHYTIEIWHNMGDVSYLMNQHGEAVSYYMMAIHTAVTVLPQESFAMVARHLFHHLGHAVLDIHTEHLTNEVKQQISEFRKLLMEQPNAYNNDTLFPIYAEEGVKFFDKNNKI